MNLLATILEVLSRADVDELTDRFVELYNQVSRLLSDEDQATAKAALEDKRLDNDEAHARLQAKLEAAKNG